MPFRIGDDGIQRGGELDKEIIAEAIAAFFIPLNRLIHLTLNEAMKSQYHAGRRLI